MSARRTTAPPTDAVRAVIFDKDGVIVDFARTWTPVIHAAARDLAGGDEARALSLLKAVGYEERTGAFRPGSVWAAGTNAELLDVWLPGADARTRAAFLARMAALCERTPPHPACPPSAMRAALAGLRRRGVKLAMVTNDTTASARNAARAFGLLELFDDITGFDRVARPKPAADPARVAAAAMGVPASAVAVIGDSPHDAAMARAAGCAMFIGVLSGTSDAATLTPVADILAADVLEAVALLAPRSAATPGRRPGAVARD